MKKVLFVIALSLASASAQAHTWLIGWKDLGAGGMDFYGLSYHGLNASADDFVTTPSGLVINGTNFTFETGSATDAGGNGGPGVASGSVSAAWNGLGLDGALQCNPIAVNCLASDGYRKFAKVHLSNEQLSSLGIGGGDNDVTLDAFSAKLDWESNGWAEPASITLIPRNIVVHIDIKFCSNPNAFNCKKGGVLPVTIFGTEDFDVLDIDVSTLQLCTEGGSCTGAPRDYSIDDRGDPTTDLGAAICSLDPETGDELDYLNMDGWDDLDAAFEASEVQAMLGVFCDDVKGATSEPLVIHGTTWDGTPVISVPVPNVGTDQLWKVNK